MCWVSFAKTVTEQHHMLHQQTRLAGTPKHVNIYLDFSSVSNEVWVTHCKWKWITTSSQISSYVITKIPAI